MSAAVFIDAGGVAGLLGLPNAAAFLRRRLVLEDRYGFPIALPHWQRPLKWRADMVARWLEEQGRPAEDEAEDAQAEAIAAGIATGKVALLDMARVP